MSNRPSIILATSNGTGMGHLAREAATALALGDRAEPIVFSLSQAAPLVRSLGLRAEYCPSHQRRFLTPSRWQHYLAERIIALVTETGARVFAFDGAWPYSGISFARAELPDVAFVWVRRALWRPGANSAALRRSHSFDVVVEPGDLAASADRGATAARDDGTRVPPVTLLEQVRRLPRSAACAELGLDPDRPTALVTLRTESLASDTAAACAVRTLLERSECQIALTRTPLTAGDLGVVSDRVVPLSGVFPLASYLSAFDLAVTEAGYNSFHEMLYSGIPTLLVPTSAAVTDDQQARASWAAEAGLAITAAEDQPEDVVKATARLLDPTFRTELSGRCAQLDAPSGAAATAEVLLNLASTFGRHRFSPRERWETVRRTVRPVVTTVIGSQTVSRLQRLLGRGDADAPTVTGPVRFVEEVDVEALRIDQPVEDLLPNRSPNYRAARENIARRYYESVHPM